MSRSSQVRVLGRVRLSRSTEESTSVERQRDVIEQWTSANNGTVVGWAEDDGVSGAVSPFEAPAFGPWLNDPEKMEQYDTVVAWKLDRFGRNATQLHSLFDWCSKNGKTLVSATEGIDLATWSGKMLAGVIGGLAEGEREAMRERQVASRQKLRQIGRWPGGLFPFGYVPVKDDDGPGWRLEIDPEARGVIQGMVDDVLSGKGVSYVVRRLNESDVLIPAEHKRKLTGKSPVTTKRWHQQTVRQILRSKSLLGYTVVKGSTVRDDNGDPVLLGEPLISLDEYERLQKFMAQKFKAASPRSYPLSGVVICPDCARPLHHTTSRTSWKRSGETVSRDYTYLSHPSEHRDCPGASGSPIAEADAAQLVEEVFLDELGELPVTERVWVSGDSKDDEIRAALDALDELQSLVGTMTSETAKARLRSQIQAKDEELARLEQAPRIEAHWEYRQIGGTYADLWKSSDPMERRDLLIRSGITVAMKLDNGGQQKTKRAAGAMYFHIRVPDGLRERMTGG